MRSSESLRLTHSDSLSVKDPGHIELAVRLVEQQQLQQQTRRVEFTAVVFTEQLTSTLTS